MSVSRRIREPGGGITGRIVEVDLSDGTILEHPLREDFFHNWLGGRGFGVALLKSYGRWCFEDVPIIVAPGPLAGYGVPSAGRCSLITRSPKTGTVFDSNAGGGLAVRLAACNIAALILHNRAKSPSIVEITPNHIRLVDATSLWNAPVDEFAERVGRGASFAVIGPAALADVPFACVMVDGDHAFGRGGLGRVFSLRNLKGLVVRAPFVRKQPAHPERFHKAVEAVERLFLASPPIKALSAFGTSFLVAVTNWLGILPAYNFSKTNLKEAEALYADATTANSARRACARCRIACKRRRGVVPLPEYETVGMLGANCGVFDYETVVKANLAANRYGVDTISAGGVLASFYAATGSWPEPRRFLDDLERLLLGEHRAINGDFGDTAVSVRGLELPAYDPRGSWGMGLAYATSTRGGCHLRGYMVAPEILRKPRPLARFTFTGKAAYLAVLQDRSGVADALGVCKFAFLGAGEEEYAEVLSAALGIDITAEEIMEVGRRIYTTERQLNEQLGQGKEKDRLPERFFKEPLGDHSPLDEREFRDALKEWYEIRGEG